MSSQFEALETNFQISDFDLLKKIGHGAFSDVFLAIHRKTFQRMALKRLDLKNLNNNILRNIQKEIEIHS